MVREAACAGWRMFRKLFTSSEFQRYWINSDGLRSFSEPTDSAHERERDCH